MLINESMKSEDIEKEKNATRFLMVFERDVKIKIHKLVAITQAKAKRRKNTNLNIPTLEDINKLSSFLDSERDKCFLQLTQNFAYQTWMKLSELTLASILLFNRRRTGEMRNIAVDDYKEREMIADRIDPLMDVWETE